VALRRLVRRRTKSSVGTGFTITGFTQTELVSHRETERGAVAGSPWPGRGVARKRQNPARREPGRVAGLA
jgi:hypothetical protein